jgi:hypothetical protein
MPISSFMRSQSSNLLSKENYPWAGQYEFFPLTLPRPVYSPFPQAKSVQQSSKQSQLWFQCQESLLYTTTRGSLRPTTMKLSIFASSKTGMTWACSVNIDLCNRLQETYHCSCIISSNSLKPGACKYKYGFSNPTSYLAL